MQKSRLETLQRSGPRRKRADLDFRRRGPDPLPAVDGGVGEDRGCFVHIFGLGIFGFDLVIESTGVPLDLATAFYAPGLWGEGMPRQDLYRLHMAVLGGPAQRLIAPCMHIAARRENSPTVCV